jgi:hypothetical protein
MLKCVALAAVLFLVCRSSLAGEFSVPVTMTGTTQLGDAVELRFDPGSAKTGELVILGNKSGGASVRQKFTYDVRGADRNSARGATTEVRFVDKQNLDISCDPLADNCRSSGYATESGATFSILWTITRD